MNMIKDYISVTAKDNIKNNMPSTYTLIIVTNRYLQMEHIKESELLALGLSMPFQVYSLDKQY